MFKKAKQEAIAKFEREYIRDALIACEGNVSRLAKEQGIDRVYTHRLIRKHKVMELIGRAEVYRLLFNAANPEKPNVG